MSNHTMTLRIADLDSRARTMLGVAWWDLTLAADAAERRRMRADNLRALDALVGRECYPIHRRTARRPARYLLCTAPGRTNMSHEVREKGWLGTTDGVDFRALGRFAVVGHSTTHLHLREMA